MEEKAREVLESNLNQLDALAAALLEHETLTRAEIDGVVKGTQTANRGAWLKTVFLTKGDEDG